MADPDEVAQDYVAQAHSRVLLQYRESPKLLGFIDALMAPVQDIENAMVLIPPLDDIDVAGGVNLDVTGDLVGQGRELVNGDVVTDEQLRLLIRARIGRNQSHATGPDIIASLALIFAAPIIFTDYGGMAIGAAIGRVPTGDEMAVLAGDILPRPMGVRLFTQWFDSTNFFGFADTPGALPFGEDNTGPPPGGRFSELF